MASLVADYGTSSGSENDDAGDGPPYDDTDRILKNACKENGDGVVEDKEEIASAEEVEEEEDEDENENENENESEPEPELELELETEKRRKVEPKKNAASNEKLPLPTPDFNGTPTLRTSVFSNPFVEAEKAKSAILEKHVKMTPTLDDTKMINGKKICWNYRKGRCRFGHNCTFAHDSDLHRSASELEAIRTPQETVICQTPYNGRINPSDDSNHNHNHSHNHNHNHNGAGGDEDDDEVDQENNQMQKRKKRPGLSQTLVPGKKVLKMYKAQQAKTIGR